MICRKRNDEVMQNVECVAMIDINSLNENQKDAVLSKEKYLRIIAGAGSGKTRVLTMRIVHLIEDENVWPTKILAITFTNKAANEMKERVRNMLASQTSAPWVSTIHSLCVRILREDIIAMGYPRNFTIMDTEDQKSVLKEAYKLQGIDATTYSYSSMLDYIANNGEVKTSDIMQAFGLKSSQSRYYLSTLVEQGRIEACGSNKNRTYKAL